MSFNSLGRSYNSPEEFKKSLLNLQPPSWCKGICLHHTGSPSLSMRPSGLSDQHLINIKNYYQNELKWRSGPQIFVDDFRIMLLTPVTEQGIHAVSFNKTYIGIEVLGNYDFENPNEGRGQKCWEDAAEVSKILLEWLDLPINNDTVKFHRDDPKTTKTCPGKRVSKEFFFNLLTPPQKAIDQPKTSPKSVVVSPVQPESKGFWNAIKRFFNL